MSLITPEYMALQQELHTVGGYGTSSGKWVGVVKALIDKEDYSSVLDYGCGKGKLKAALGDIVQEYDPCIEGKDADPPRADLVVCTDVLEHIESACLDDVLHHLHSKAQHRVFISVSIRPAQKTLSDGRNAHLIIQGAEWWRAKFATLFKIDESNTVEGDCFSFVGKPLRALGQVKSFGVMADDERNANSAQNVVKTDKRLPDEPVAAHDGTIILACYGPSLNATVDDLVAQRKTGTLVSVSGAHDYLRHRGLIPDFHVECDPRPHKSKMLLRPHDNTKYMMASCCHPALISRLANYDLTLWHLFNGQGSFAIRDIPTEKYAAMIPGGGSVGLRCLTLFYFLGYRKFIIHGMDCSFSDEAQHAGAHTGKVQDEITVHPSVKMPDGGVLWADRQYKTSPVLVSYANHFMKDYLQGRFPGTSFDFRGDGMLQEMLRLVGVQMGAMGLSLPQDSRDYFSLEQVDYRPEEIEENAA